MLTCQTTRFSRKNPQRLSCKYCCHIQVHTKPCSDSVETRRRLFNLRRKLDEPQSLIAVYVQVAPGERFNNGLPVNTASGAAH